MAIQGELYVDFNGTLTKAHLVTEAELVEGLNDKIDNQIGEAVVRQPSATFIADDTILEAGVMAIETDTNYVKIGDGVSTYTQLEYLNGRNGALNGLLVEVMDEEGHYDESGIDDVILEYQDAGGQYPT